MASIGCGGGIGLALLEAVNEMLHERRIVINRMVTRCPVLVMECGVVRADLPHPNPILACDTARMQIYTIDGTYVVVNERLDRRASDIVTSAARKLHQLHLHEWMRLVQVASSGGRQRHFHS